MKEQLKTFWLNIKNVFTNKQAKDLLALSSGYDKLMTENIILITESIDDIISLKSLRNEVELTNDERKDQADKKERLYKRVTASNKHITDTEESLHVAEDTLVTAREALEYSRNSQIVTANELLEEKMKPPVIKEIPSTVFRGRGRINI